MENSRQSSLFDFLGNKVETEENMKQEVTDGDSFPAAREAQTLGDWAEKCYACSGCQLRQGCRHPVFGEGNPETDLMLVGEAPGADEDRQGLPFVGRAGQLLNRILEAIGMSREEVYITNVIKCRPPGNRLPEAGEVKECFPYLEKQIEIIDPEIVVCLGSLSTRTLIRKDAKITRMRGQWVKQGERWYMPTFHPAALLRDVNKKKPVWEDFQKIRSLLDELTQ